MPQPSKCTHGIDLDQDCIECDRESYDRQQERQSRKSHISEPFETDEEEDEFDYEESFEEEEDDFEDDEELDDDDLHTEGEWDTGPDADDELPSEEPKR